jgi:hypothetical protein
MLALSVGQCLAWWLSTSVCTDSQGGMFMIHKKRWTESIAHDDAAAAAEVVCIATQLLSCDVAAGAGSVACTRPLCATGWQKTLGTLFTVANAGSDAHPVLTSSNGVGACIHHGVIPRCTLASVFAHRMCQAQSACNYTCSHAKADVHVQLCFRWERCCSRPFHTTRLLPCWDNRPIVAHMSDSLALCRQRPFSHQCGRPPMVSRAVVAGE